MAERLSHGRLPQIYRRNFQQQLGIVVVPRPPDWLIADWASLAVGRVYPPHFDPFNNDHRAAQLTELAIPLQERREVQLTVSNAPQ